MSVVEFSKVSAKRKKDPPGCDFTKSELGKLMELYHAWLIKGVLRDYACSIKPDFSVADFKQDSNARAVASISKQRASDGGIEFVFFFQHVPRFRGADIDAVIEGADNQMSELGRVIPIALPHALVHTRT